MRLRALALYVGLALIVGAITGYIYASLRNPEPTSVPVIQVREQPEVLDDNASPGDRKKQKGSSKGSAGDRATDGGVSGTSGGSSGNSPTGGTPQQESSGGSGGKGPGAQPAAPPPPAPAGQDDDVDVDVDNDLADRGDDSGSD